MLQRVFCTVLLSMFGAATLVLTGCAASASFQPQAQPAGYRQPTDNPTYNNNTNDYPGSNTVNSNDDLQRLPLDAF